MAIGEFLTTSDVADALDLSESRIRQFVMMGRLKPTKKIGQYLFFDRDSVREFAKHPRETGRPAKKVSNPVDKAKRKR